MKLTTLQKNKVVQNKSIDIINKSDKGKKIKHKKKINLNDKLRN